MSKAAVKKLIKAAARDPKILSALKNKPNSIAKKFGLSRPELVALVSADKLMVIGNSLAGTTTLTFTTGTTMTVKVPKSELAVGPRTRLTGMARLGRGRGAKAR